MIAFRGLHRIATATTPPPLADAAEVCGLCGAAISPEHRHVVDLVDRGLHCACQGCAILFVRDDAIGARFRTIPTRVVTDDRTNLAVARWTALGVPVGLAFVFFNSVLGRPIVCYPGAAGIVEGELAPGAWDALLAATPLAAAVRPDVEALLIHAARGAPLLDAYLIPIDVAYGLAGQLRARWRGFGGGDEVRAVLDTLFADLARRSRPLASAPAPAVAGGGAR